MIRLTEEQKITLDMVRKVAEREIAPRAKDLDEKSLFPEHALELFSELGLLNPLLPAENRIGEEGDGFANLMKTLSMNRVFCAAQAVGIAQGALDEATRHARERIQFGKPIAEQPVIQSMVADMATAVEAARLLTREAAARFDEGDARGGALFGGMAKTFASDTAMRVTTDSVQILGGYGYMKDHSVERMMRDAKLTQIYTGTNQITRLVTGRSLLLS